MVIYLYHKNPNYLKNNTMSENTNKNVFDENLNL